MSQNQFLLLKTPRFLPLFVTQFLGAFHDNLFKNAFVVLLLFDAGAQVQNPKMLTTLAAGVFILPFVLFSALAGQLADKFSKDRIIRIVKITEVGIAVLGIASIFSVSIYLSFMTLFALGTHSAFFGPSKYSILPQHLEKAELIGGNALVNTGTFLAILLGTLAGASLVTMDGGKIIVSLIIAVTAVSGYGAARFIPPALPTASDIKLNLNPITETYSILRQTFSQPAHVLQCIIGISWFWFLGAMFLAQLPNYTHESLHANEHVLSLFLVLFSVGIALGGLVNNRLLGGKIKAIYVPLAVLGISIFSVDLYFSAGAIDTEGALLDVSQFISKLSNWRIISDILMISVCGGLFVVPLNAIVQHSTPEDQRARILAGSAITNAIMMVISSVISAILIGMEFSIAELFAIFAAANLGAVLYLNRLRKVQES